MKEVVAAAHHVSYRYGTTLALDDVSLAVHQGEALAILGPNGAGKTTLVANLLGLRPPSSGTVALFGGPPAQAVRQGRVAAMLQETSLPEFATVGETVQYVASLYPRARDSQTVMRLAGIEDLARRPVSRLSGGQRRRVQFALTLVANAEFLFLDEPTVGMDIEARAGLWELLRQERYDATERTVVFTTHDLQEADRFADRVLLLSQGRVVAEGTPDVLKSRLTRPRVRFRAPPDLACDEVERRAGLGIHLAPDGWYEVETSDSDAALRSLLRLDLGLYDFRVKGGTLDDVFQALVASDRKEEPK